MSYTDQPDRDYDNHTAHLEADEARFDKQVEDYIQWMLRDFKFLGTRPSGELWGEYTFNNYLREFFEDVADLDELRRNLLAGEPSKAGQALIESLQAYLKEVAAIAVRERKE